MWVGRTAATIFGLALVLALIFGVATMAFAAAAGDPFKLGLANRINALTTLIGSSSGAMLAIDNDSTASTARALDLRVEENRAPMRVNSDRMVPNLNADQLDGMHADALPPRGYAQVNVTSATVTLTNSKGIEDVQRSTTDTSVYCFDLTFVPKVAVASAHINNDSTVGTGLGSAVPSGCPEGFEDAAARTYASDAAPTSVVNFRIIFV